MTRLCQNFILEQGNFVSKKEGFLTPFLQLQSSSLRCFSHRRDFTKHRLLCPAAANTHQQNVLTPSFIIYTFLCFPADTREASQAIKSDPESHFIQMAIPIPKMYLWSHARTNLQVKYLIHYSQQYSTAAKPQSSESLVIPAAFTSRLLWRNYMYPAIIQSLLKTQVPSARMCLCFHNYRK